MTLPEDELQHAVALHRAGQRAQAEAAYHRVLRAVPEHPDAWHMLGVLALAEGNPREALKRIRRAVAAGLDTSPVHCNLGAALAAAGETDAAREQYERLLRRWPNMIDAWYNLAKLEHRTGRLEAAQLAFERTVALRPSHASAWHNLGVLQRERGALSAAMQSFTRAVEHEPKHAQAWFQLGQLQHLHDEVLQAVKSLERAVALQPDNVEFRYRFGRAQESAGQLEEAVASLSRVVDERPDWPEAWNSLGVARQREQKLDEALECFRRAVACNPQLIEALCNIAVIHQLKGRFEAAISEGIDRALAVDPRNIMARRLVAQVQLERGRLAEARENLEQALVTAPPGPLRDVLRVSAAIAVPAIFASRAEMEAARTRAHRELDALAQEALAFSAPLPPFYIGMFYWAYQGVNDRPLMTKLASILRRSSPELCFVAPHCQAGRVTLDGGRKMRVGIVSRYLMGHSVGRVVEGVIRELPRASLELTLFRFIPAGNDPTAQRIDAAADHVTIIDSRLTAAQRQIAAAELDVLIYADIGMDMVTGWLAHARLAPVQVALAGHPVTSGIPTLDYYLSCAAFEPPDADEHYSEQLVRLPFPPVYAFRPKQPAAKERVDYGLDPARTIYMCLQTLFKVHPDFDDILDQILQRDPEAEIILFETPESGWADMLRARWRAVMGARAERIRFLSRQSTVDYLRLMELADVVLDTVHFGGGTTSLDAIGLGVPVVNWRGPYMRGRVTAGLLDMIGVPDTTVANFNDYVDLAVKLAHDPGRRADIRQKLLAKHDLLYENQQAVTGLTEFLLSLAGKIR